MRACMLVLLLVGCDDLLAPDGGGGIGLGGPDVVQQGQCPIGWIVVDPAEVDVNVRTYNLTGLVQSLELHTEPWQDIAPVCASDSRDQIQVLLERAGEPYAWLQSASDGPTNTGLSASTGVTFSVLGEAEPITFGTGDWFQGNWTVDGDNGVWTHTINGQARSGVDSLTLWVEVTL
ncbi:MAG: hypothetical protein AB8H79_25205 [Myxococcota bacterium]